MDLRDRLQGTLGSAYTIERELGGGGMSRVFVATEIAFDRKVVVKVLPPELTGEVSVERFRREIQLAAQLQHPHIVPVHASGETDSVPYYTMPLVDGMSLRARLASPEPLALSEVIGILRDVAKALAYAHERGVVHRDIKPDNVLLTGGSAVVTDFGIAKALSASRMAAPAGTLTQVGISLGTPAYMAPEQVAADPSTDHRADIYSFGCMAYEMLAGRPPFVGRTPQRLLAAQMGEKPESIAELRGDTPPLLADLVMRSLEKEADDRPQSALELVRVLESVSAGGYVHPASDSLRGGPTRLAGALGLYAAAFAAVALLAKAAIVGIGLPAWVFSGAMIIMVLGLPAILITAFVYRGASQARTMVQATPGGSSVAQSTMMRLAVKASPWVNWRRTAMGGVIAIGSFALLVAAYMASRALGIGPAASLIASGALGQHDKLLITDFKSPSSDTSLGPVVTEALRSHLAQSDNFTVMQPAVLRETLRRMQKPADARVDFQLAREIATREGVKAVLDGEILSLGGGYVIAVRLSAAQSGDVLATFRVTAREPRDIIPAIDELARSVRAKAGESLKKVNSAPPLEQVTTQSLEALRKYVQALRVLDEGGEFDRGVALLEEAIAIDTGFAMAYRKLGTVLSNYGGYRTRARAALQKAFEHRDRLSDAERYMTEGSYYSSSNILKATAAFEALAELQPNNATAFNNAANLYRFQRRFADAERAARRAIELSGTSLLYFTNLFYAQLSQGKVDDAERTRDQFARLFPSNPRTAELTAELVAGRGLIDSAEKILTTLRNSQDRATKLNATLALSDFAMRRGGLKETRRLYVEAGAVAEQQGIAFAGVMPSVMDAMIDVWYLEPERAVSKVDAVLKRYPLDKIPPSERPYGPLANIYALAGRADLARGMMTAFERSTGLQSWGDSVRLSEIRGDIAMAERRYDDAIREYRAADRGDCLVCHLPALAHAYDVAGMSDSAIATFTRYIDGPPDPDRVKLDSWYLAGAHKRLGEIYEGRGDRQKAATHYMKFVELWKNADPELQPKVAEVRKRLARLSDMERR